MHEWIEPQDVQVPEALQTAVGGHPLVAETLARRGITDVTCAQAFLDPDRYRPALATELPNLARAVERLECAIAQGERICVWGDFDVDGQTATTILVSTLRDLGAVVQHHIPVRAKESHGVNLPVLERVIADGVDLVLTCDTGVGAHEAVDYARSQGVDVIVTDHHDLPPLLPEAYAVVNPKMLPESHPLRELSGAGCAYKLVEALYDRVGRSADATRYLDLVALGLVADVAVQTGDTRYLTQRGLEALRHTGRLGLRVMMDLANLNLDWLTEEHIGFQLAPRLNALGRLDDANPIVELLTTDDVTRARTLATELEGLNAQRKLLCDQVFQAAQAQIERDPSLLDYAALVLSHPAWPGGVVGIVAGRLAERYHRPAILLTTPPDQLGRGSARSVAGCDINAAIAAQAGLLHGFGGHPMAAGLSIDPERIPEFRRALSRTISETCEIEETPKLQVDAFLALTDLSLELIEEIERLAPFGPGNPSLTLATKGLSLVSLAPIGRNGEHLQLIVEDEAGNTQKVLWWRGAGEPLPEGRFDLAYTVRASDYRGQRDVQVEWTDARAVEKPTVSLRPAAPVIEVLDHRRELRPRAMLEQLQAREEVQVWAEADAKAQVRGRDRRELAATKTLAVWTAPPGPAEWQDGLAKASPQKVVLFGINPGLDDPELFLKRLAGLAKHALRADAGRASISALAAATAQRESSVWAGLAWLTARGYLAVASAGDDEVQLTVGEGRADADLPRVAAHLRMLIEETAAYRAYFARVEKETLV
ncbi:MAG: single-stranded-DNA-specific exonuclease RecJ [Anaerolineae bacterium]|nr:single-stranded-DNA-specific exonuclease RecJ [Anaerolineae bacterium]